MVMIGSAGQRAVQGEAGGNRCRFAPVFLLFSLLLSPAVWGAEPVTVKVHGLEGEMLENVQAALALPPGLVREGKVDRRWLERFRQQAPEKVRRALEPFGYYRAEVRTDLQAEDGNYRLVVRVEPGPPVRVSKVQVALQGAGEGRSALRELVREFPLQENAVLRQDLYEQAKGAIKARALDLGYLAADFSRHEIRVNPEEGTAEIDLVLDTGPLYHFDGVTIKGAEEYPPAFLRRYLGFRSGEVFSYAKLGQTQLNFLDSDRFKQVIVTPHEKSAENLEVPVTIQLEPSLPKRLRPGIGYATDTGARFSLRYKDVNAFHLGHELQRGFPHRPGQADPGRRLYHPQPERHRQPDGPSPLL